MTNVKCQIKDSLFNLLRRSFVIFNLSLVIWFGGCGDIVGEISSLTISPSNPTVGVNQTQLFTAVAKDTMGQIVSVSVVWSVTSGYGRISSSGLFTAGNTAETVVVTAAYSTIMANANATITEKGWLEGYLNSGDWPVNDLRVYLKESPDLQAYTDATGHYSIANIPTGTYNAVFDGSDLFYATSGEVVIDRGATVTWTTQLISIITTTNTTIPTFTI
jgi:hypothetical protein